MPKIIFGALTIAILSSLSIAHAAEKSPIQIKVSSTGADGTARYATLLKFKEEMTKKFGERVEVIVSTPSNSYKEGEEFEALGFDLVNIVVPSTSRVAAHYNFKDLYLFDLPYLFRNHDDIKKYIDSPLSKKILSDFSEKEHVVTPLAFWIGDYKNFYGNKPLVDVSSFNGLAGSVETENGISNIYQTSLGVSGVRAQSETQLVNSIMRKSSQAPDVTELSSSFILAKELYKEYKDLTKSQHIVSNYVVLTNKRWFGNLPDDIRDGVKTIAQNLVSYHFEEARSLNSKALDKLVTEGVQIHDWSKDNRNRFVNKAVPAHEYYLKNINAQYLQEVYKTIR